ncbi:MAG TPA: glycosyltransferase family 39 protein [Aggregatilineaceae bacterium]|nr:glycosyltransferase family 39 protein [Aggregatilineaceae bacterium]
MWLKPTLLLFPYAAWIFLGVGIPWALALLPREHWRERVTVAAVGMALGPLGVTAWMFVVGTVGHITLVNTLAGSVVIALIGAGLAWRRRGETIPPSETGRERLHIFEWFLIVGIVLVLLVSVIITAFWPFVMYDPQWVYAYNGRLFFTEKSIPDDIGYYPQLLALSYTTMQQAWGGINDHAARVVVPWLTVASVLMSYVLGQRIFQSRRIGLLTAAVWAFYPHMLAWSGTGDLEIPVTIYVTGAAAYFVEAWRTGHKRAAMLSGVLLGGALWTKPTSGALALGIMLAVAVWLARRDWSKLEIGITVGIACAPLGGMWYIRNLLLGHGAVDFPADYWHDFAQRSGQELGWPLLIAALAVGGLLLRERSKWRRIGLVVALILLLIGILPTAINFDTITHNDNLWKWARGDVWAVGRLDVFEWALIAGGFGLIGALGYKALRERRDTVILLWLLMLPYAVVWFLDFSYHYRLSFAIVPLFAVQVAALVDGWLWDWLAQVRWRATLGWGCTTALIGVALVAGAESTWQHRNLQTDRAKHDEVNPALMIVVHQLEAWAEENGDPVIVIPGEERLPFFFPDWEIRNSRAELPTRLEDLGDADIYIGGSVPEFLMKKAGHWPNSLMADVAVGTAYHRVSAVGSDGERWPTVLQPIPLHRDGSLSADDGIFRYEAFTVHPEARQNPLNPVAPVDGEVIIGDFAQFVGHDVTTLTWYRGTRVFLTLYWKPTDSAPPPQDYSIYIHLLDENGTWIAGWDGTPLQKSYPTRFWRAGESLMDYWVLQIPDDIPAGPAKIRIGIYDPVSQTRLPVMVNGEQVGDGLTINDLIVVE